MIGITETMAPTKEYQIKEKVKKLTFKEKCSSCLRGPKQILRSAVLLTCTFVVAYQIMEFVKKIRNPPITTYTHFDFNETIEYPAVTICRDPPYKADVLEKYGLYGHPRYTSEWKYFPFDTVDLEIFWNEATYSDKDNFIAYGLNSSADNILINNSLHFKSGKCQTMYPKLTMPTALKQTGYSILLNHSILDIDHTSSTIPPGYHVYIHQVDEPFVEHTAASLMEYLYVNVGEELDIKLGVQQINMLQGGPKECVDGKQYSFTNCVQNCIWEDVELNVGCTGPWMKSKIPFCKNYTEMKNLIVHYISLTGKVDTSCTCPRRCRSSLYSAYVVDRNSLTIWDSDLGKWYEKTGKEKYQTLMYIYFNSKTVSVYEETHGYDWSLFIADFGGSLGFLLGLSVLGVISLLEELFVSFIQPFVPSKPTKGPDDDSRENNLSRRGGDGDSIKNGAEKMDVADKKHIIREYEKFDANYGGSHY